MRVWLAVVAGVEEFGLPTVSQKKVTLTLLRVLYGGHVCHPSYHVPLIADDSDDDDTTDLPDLDHATKPHVPAPVFEVLDDADKTWSAVWDKVRAVLVRRGHKCRTLLRVIERVRPLKRDTDKRGEKCCISSDRALSPIAFVQ